MVGKLIDPVSGLESIHATPLVPPVVAAAVAAVKSKKMAVCDAVIWGIASRATADAHDP